LVDVDHVAYAFDPWLVADRPHGDGPHTLSLQPSTSPQAAEWEAVWGPLFVASIINAPHHLAGDVPHHLQARLGGACFDGPARWHCVDHQRAHAASAFHASPFERAAVLTLDGRGERATTTYSLGHGRQLERLGQVDLPHSLGLLYVHVTAYLGF